MLDNIAPGQVILVKEKYDVVAVFLGMVVAFLTFLAVVALPLLVNSVWIGLVEVPLFFAGFYVAGKLMAVKNKE